MISNLRAEGATLVVLALFAVAGFVSVCWVAAGWAERMTDWWRDRRERRGVDPPWWWKPWLRRFRRRLHEDDFELEDVDHGWCGRDDLLELPPERTWEQMTSHQLPLTEIAERNPRWVAAGRPMLTAAQERRPPAYEIEHRAHYVAMGFDYPSGLMARVREAAQ